MSAVSRDRLSPPRLVFFSRGLSDEGGGADKNEREGRLRVKSASIQFALLCFALITIGCRSSHRTTLTLSVAASLQESITEIEVAYQREHSIAFRNNFGASATLAREIEQGAPVDAFVSAGVGPMNQLQSEGLLLEGSRGDLLRNRLVLIAPSGSELKDFEGLTAKQVRTVALGDPASVPAGHYGKQTLEALHLYGNLRSKLVLGKDVRQVLTYVETGDADAGLVYITDAETSHRVRVVVAAPENSHDPIIYPVSEIKNSQNGSAVREFIAFLRSPAARAIFERHGFRMA
jgi:molybdate transport system substrate-binding protein